MISYTFLFQWSILHKQTTSYLRFELKAEDEIKKRTKLLKSIAHYALQNKEGRGFFFTFLKDTHFFRVRNYTAEALKISWKRIKAVNNILMHHNLSQCIFRNYICFFPMSNHRIQSKWLNIQSFQLYCKTSKFLISKWWFSQTNHLNRYRTSYPRIFG